MHSKTASFCRNPLRAEHTHTHPHKVRERERDRERERERERERYQSMIMGSECFCARSRIWSRWSLSLMCSIATVVGLDKSGQNASTLMSLLKLFLHSLFLLSIQYPDELLCKIKNLPLLIEYCCCWSRWWNSLYRIWAFAAITDIFSLSLSLPPNSFLFKKKRNK